MAYTEFSAAPRYRRRQTSSITLSKIGRDLSGTVMQMAALGTKAGRLESFQRQLAGRSFSFLGANLGTTQIPQRIARVTRPISVPPVPPPTQFGSKDKFTVLGRSLGTSSLFNEDGALSFVSSIGNMFKGFRNTFQGSLGLNIEPKA